MRKALLISGFIVVSGIIASFVILNKSAAAEESAIETPAP